STPAGIIRTPAINNGVVWEITPFIATIAVPQRKKGAIGIRGVKESRDALNFSCMRLLTPLFYNCINCFT
ncbi:hypothetical protein, partial [Fischerella thermalis]|uniref:hypothetical protein n=1 Tax=Fischerella thermalis TaxID=372787 RepID=UPI001CA53946